MNEATKKQLADILAAQVQKQNEAKTKITAPKPAPAPALKKITADTLPETYNTLEEITAAAKSGKIIDILNLSNIVTGKTTPPPAPEPQQETEQVTEQPAADLFTFEVIEEAQELTTEEAQAVNFEDLSEVLTPLFKPTAPANEPAPQVEQPAQEPQPTPAHAVGLEIVPYTAKSFLVKGPLTKEYKEELKILGGIFRPYWNGHGAAWMFANTKLEDLTTFINNL